MSARTLCLLTAVSVVTPFIASSACANGGPISQIAEPLTSSAGNSQRGRAVFLDRTTGHCLLCHSVQSISEPSQGNIGPALDGIASRLTAAQLRLRLTDSTMLNPNSAMPAYYRTEKLVRVANEYQGKSVLSAQQIEDLIAYLLTLDTKNDE